MYRSKLADNRLAEKLSHCCHFSHGEIAILMNHYRDICKDSVMDKATFIDILQNTFDMTDDLLIDRIFRIFDKNNDGKISIEEWILGLSVILCGTMEEKMTFCFHVYDLAGDSCISREGLYTLLKNRMQRTGDEDPDDTIKDFIEMIINKMDDDKDGHLSYADYKKSVLQEPLFMQAFGPCLPEEKLRIAFLALFIETIPK